MNVALLNSTESVAIKTIVHVQPSMCCFFARILESTCELYHGQALEKERINERLHKLPHYSRQVDKNTPCTDYRIQLKYLLQPFLRIQRLSKTKCLIGAYIRIIYVLVLASVYKSPFWFLRLSRRQTGNYTVFTGICLTPVEFVL